MLVCPYKPVLLCALRCFDESKRATQAYKTPSPKAAAPDRAPPKLGRKNPRKCQFV